MHIIGWIALTVFALLGLYFAVIALWEHVVTQYILLQERIRVGLKVWKEDIAAKGELKRARLAGKREIADAVQRTKAGLPPASAEKPQPKKAEKPAKEETVSEIVFNEADEEAAEAEANQ